MGWKLSEASSCSLHISVIPESASHTSRGFERRIFVSRVHVNVTPVTSPSRCIWQAVTPTFLLDSSFRQYFCTLGYSKGRVRQVERERERETKLRKWERRHRVWRVFVKFQVRISVGLPADLIEVLHGFVYRVQANTRMVQTSRLLFPPPKSLPNNHWWPSHLMLFSIKPKTEISFLNSPTTNN
jgi:hypothetical protein